MTMVSSDFFALTSFSTWSTADVFPVPGCPDIYNPFFSPLVKKNF